MTKRLFGTLREIQADEPWYKWRGTKRATCEFLEAGLTTADITAIETEHGLYLTEEVVDLYRFCNGGRIFGMTIQPLQMAITTYSPDHLLLCFHDWGTGDFDAVRCSQDMRPEASEVVWLWHSANRKASVCDSLSTWFARVRAEAAKYGEIVDPEAAVESDRLYHGLAKQAEGTDL